MKDAKQEAARIQTRVGQLGVATVLLDQDGKLHVLPGHDFVVLGCYSTGVRRIYLIEDIHFAAEKIQALPAPTAENKPYSGGK